MQSLAIVETFDVGKDAALRGLLRRIDEMMGEFGFERGKETLGRGIVIAVACATHTAKNALLRQQRAIGITRVLATAVRVVHLCRMAGVAHRHAQGALAQRIGHLRIHRPAHNAARVRGRAPRPGKASLPV